MLCVFVCACSCVRVCVCMCVFCAPTTVSYGVTLMWKNDVGYYRTMHACVR